MPKPVPLSAGGTGSDSGLRSRTGKGCIVKISEDKDSCKYQDSAARPCEEGMELVQYAGGLSFCDHTDCDIGCGCLSVHAVVQTGTMICTK